MVSLLIDNYDSFTWNLFQLLCEVNGQEPIVVKNDEDWRTIESQQFDNIVISPGPGRPGIKRDFGISLDALEETKLPILGVCLGHQGLCKYYGADVVHAPQPYHGRTSAVLHQQHGLFRGIPSPFDVVRYHSLIVNDLPESLEVIASTKDGLIMAVQHKTLPRWGVQFHPESICSEYGRQLLRNFSVLTLQWQIDGEKKQENIAPGKYQILTRQLGSINKADQAYVHFYENSRNTVWLDSSRYSPQGRFSFMADASGPLSEIIRYSIETKTAVVESRFGIKNIENVSLFDYLNLELNTRKTPIPDNLPFEFNLGYIGYLGYELKVECGGNFVHQSPYPDATFLFVDRMIAFDHEDNSCWLLCLVDPEASDYVQQLTKSKAWFEQVEKKLTDLRSVLHVPLKSKKSFRDICPIYRHSKSAYISKINACQEKINDGESYEICLTNMAELSFDGSDLSTYLSLRKKSPVPFGAFLRFDNLSILSASPERFISISSRGLVESRPIKGTRKVELDESKDQDTINDLRNNEKDKAENLMIVDLVRNDLNRTCQPGSVHAFELFAVESFSYVHQLVSTIRGVLTEKHSSIDCIRSAFPGGSMTGAPKIRTMEIIDELEEGPRGIYSGNIGWFALNGAVDLNIVIRTIVLREGVATYGVGGAIIALSDAEMEYEETMIKARSALSVLLDEGILEDKKRGV